MGFVGVTLIDHIVTILVANINVFSLVEWLFTAVVGSNLAKR